jgi:hypothetical protein
MKVPKRPAGKPSRRATRSDRQQRNVEPHPKTSDLLPSIDWVRPQTPKPIKAKKSRRGGKK